MAAASAAVAEGLVVEAAAVAAARRAKEDLDAPDCWKSEEAAVKILGNREEPLEVVVGYYYHLEKALASAEMGQAVGWEGQRSVP